MCVSNFYIKTATQVRIAEPSLSYLSVLPQAIFPNQVPFYCQSPPELKMPEVLVGMEEFSSPHLHAPFCLNSKLVPSLNENADDT